MPQGVGEKHADDIMPEDLRPENLSHGASGMSPPPSLPPVEDDGEADGDPEEDPVASAGACPLLCTVSMTAT